MYTDPVIAGTNRRPICCMLAMRWRTVTAIDHPLLILYWGSTTDVWTFTYTHRPILMIYHNGISAEGDLTNEDEERIGHVTLIDLHWERLVKTTIWVFGDKVTVSVIKTSKKSLYEVRQLWLTVRKIIALNRVQREKRRQSDEYLSRQQWLKIEAELSTCSC